MSAECRKTTRYWLVAVGAGLLIPAWGLLAQSQPPEHGPSQADLDSYRAQYEARYNQAPTAPEAEAEPFQPQFEQPGEIPTEARQYATDAELVQIYCAMTRWKSGDFFASMEAVKKHVLPLYDKAREIEPSIVDPDVDGFIAEGRKRVDAICAAASADEADRLTKDFIAWGRNTVFAEMANSKKLMADKLNKASESIRTKAEEAIKPTIEQKEASIRASAEAKADELVKAMQSRFEGRTSAPSESELAAAVAEIDRGVQAYIAPLIAAAETEISSKAQEAVAPEKARFEAIGQMGREINAKMAADIQAAKPDYYQYRDEAVALRKKIILGYLDKNLGEVMTKLEASRADLAAAKRSDPSLMDVDQIKAAVTADRQALEPKLTAAIESDDEAAIQKVLNDFRQKWEDFRAEAEKAATVGVAKGCAIAEEQFAAARVKIQENSAKISAVAAPCAASTSEECQTVNEFAPRLGELEQKLGDLQFGMDMAEKLCQDPQNADRNELIGVLQQVRTDAEDVKVFGEALEADKNKVLAETGDQICAQALPQLRAAVKEIAGSDMAALSSNISRCGDKNAAKNFPFCADVKANEDKFKRVKDLTDKFVKDVALAEDLCSRPTAENGFERLVAALNRLKTTGDDVRQSALELRAITEQKLSGVAFCRSVTGLLDEMTAGISGGLTELKAIDVKLIQPACRNQNSNDCSRINAAVGKDVYANFERDAKLILDKIAALRQACAAADTSPPKDAMVTGFNEVTTKAAELKAKADTIKKNADKLSATGKVAVWIEAEDAARFNVRTGVDDPMAREVNPSWRPRYFGSGSWYMGRGKDYLEYDIKVPAAGTYKVWVRDLASALQSQWGVRRIYIYFDGKRFGPFEENAAARSIKYPPGGFRWHKVADVALTAGDHKMRVEKVESSNGAAILDAFYLTTGTDTPAEK